MGRFDVAINSGLLLDGTGCPPILASIGIRDGRVAEVRDTPIGDGEMPEFGGYQRMVRRNDAAVLAVLVGGSVAVRSGVPVPALGHTKYGTFLGAGEQVAATPARSGEIAA